MILTFFIIISAVLIIFILLQQGKGAEESSAFGSSNKAAVSSSFSTGAKIIAALALVFFVLVFTLHLTNNDKKESGLLDKLEKQSKGKTTPEKLENSIPTTPASQAPATGDQPTNIPE